MGERLHIPGEDWELIQSGVQIAPRYRRVDQPGDNALVERQPRVRRVPAVTTSARRLSVPMLERNAYRVARQARAGARHGRPVEWLAMTMYALDRYRPEGARRADARLNIAHTAARAAAVADFGSGRHAMPGLQDTAAQTGRCERTITRHWAVLTGLGLLRRDEPGRWLTAAERDQVAADPDQRTRWRNRAEYTLLIPEWVREVNDAELAPWLTRARQVWTQVTGQDPGPVDNPSPQASDTGSVDPPSGDKLITYLPVRRTKFSLDAAANRQRRPRPGRPPSRPSGRADRAASRPSPTKDHHPSSVLGRKQGVRRPMPPEAVAAARQLAADRRFPWLAQAPRPMLAALLRRFPGWTPDDVHVQVEATLRDRGWSTPPWVIAPVAYLARLLAGADPARPPAAAARAEQAARQAEQAARRREAARQAAEREARKVPGSAVPAVQQLRVRMGWPGQPDEPGQLSTTPATAARRSPAALHAVALERARRERRDRHRRNLGLPPTSA